MIDRPTDLRGEDLEVDAGEALEVLPEEALGVVLPDLLPRHRRRPEPNRLLEAKGRGGGVGGVPCVRACVAATSERATTGAVRDSGRAAPARAGRAGLYSEAEAATGEQGEGKRRAGRDRDASRPRLVVAGFFRSLVGWGPPGRVGWRWGVDGIWLGWCGEWCDQPTQDQDPHRIRIRISGLV